jgi:hypothetical protein
MNHQQQQQPLQPAVAAQHCHHKASHSRGSGLGQRINSMAPEAAAVVVVVLGPALSMAPTTAAAAGASLITGTLSV